MPDRVRPWLAPVIVALVAAVLWLPGLGEHGIWPGTELEALERARAALGEPLSGLVRAPWLPDVLRREAVRVLGDSWGLRLPGALAAIALAALATGLAQLSLRTAAALLAGCIVLAQPAVALGARLAVTDTLGQLLAATAIASGIATLGAERTSTRALALTATALGLVGAVASAGLLFGAFVPLLVLACTPMRRGALRLRVAALGAAVAVLIATVILAWSQADGFIPILAAAKDPELLDQPQLRRSLAGLEDFAYQTFPWAPFALLGALEPRLVWIRRWWLVTLACGAGWSLIYGPTTIPAAIPTAILAAGSLAVVLGPERDAARDPTRTRLRRFAAVLLLAGTSLLVKDASRTPERIVAATADVSRPEDFPAERLHGPERLADSAWLIALVPIGLIAGTALHRWGPAQAQTTPEVRRRWHPARLHPVAAIALALAGLTHAARLSFGLLPDASALLSPQAMLARADAAIASEAVTAPLFVLRIRDPLVERYGPPLEPIGSRSQLLDRLAGDEPVLALTRASEVPFIHAAHRTHGWPWFVLDDRHRDYRLVGNRLPPGWDDRNHLNDIVRDEPPAGLTPTHVRFDDAVELIGWQLEGPLLRGQEAELVLAFRTLEPLPAGTKLYARLLSGRLSRVNTEPRALTQGRYPPNAWRSGDIVVHRERFEVPVLETMPGRYDIVVGLRRSQHHNIPITQPEGETGDHGVEIIDRRHSFAKLGEVQIW